jgi:long-chain acyl-CoA synthetase
MGMFFDHSTSIPAAFFDYAQQNPQKVLFSQALFTVNEGSEARAKKAITFAEVESQVIGLATVLKKSGLTFGTRVAVVSNSRPEWLVADLAILAAGGVVVSVYQSLTPVDIGYLLYDSQAEFVFVENQEQLDKIVYLMENEFEVAATEERAALKTRVALKGIIAFEKVKDHALVSQFSVAITHQGEGLGIDQIKRDALATLVYTSGTSGPPKGVMQTHGNHLANLRQAFEAGMYQSESSIILFLPLAHSFARLMAYIGCLAGPTIHFPAILDKNSSKLDQKSITRDIAEADATIIPLVPRILEKMKLGVEERAQAAGLNGFLIKIMLCGIQGKVRLLKREGIMSVTEVLCYKITAKLRKLIRRKLFGTQLINVISGGAKLADDINYFFEALEIPVLQGYGLTETSVATNVNRLAHNRIGTVGPVLSKDIELRIATDGEILFRGPNIALGYLNRVKATLDAWDQEGWFHTGDIGVLSDDLYLSITGRKKELIVTAGGKKIAPEAIEAKLKASSLFSQVVLVGEGKPYCCVLVTLNPSVVNEQFKESGAQSAEPYSSNLAVQQLVQNEIDLLNKQLASFETVKRFHIIDADFSIENGFLTPTMKVKRMLVIRRFEKEIEALYRGYNG